MPLNTRCNCYNAMAMRWDLIDDLMGGTPAMRAARTKWLPQEHAEKKEIYENRLGRSILFNIYRDTARKMSARPFSKPVKIENEEAIPEFMKTFRDNVDGRGTSIESFFRKVYDYAATRYGVSHVLIDHPSVGAGAVSTLADRDALRGTGARPYLMHVTAKSLIGWEEEFDSDTGRWQPSNIRIEVERVDEIKDYEEKTALFIQEWTATTFKEWRKTTNDSGTDTQFTLVTERDHDYGRVPLYTLNLEPDDDSESRMAARPPLEDLAYMTLAHWQTFSDQKHILKMIRVPDKYATGWDKKDFDGGFVSSVSQIHVTKNVEAQIRIVEVSGAAAEVGFRDVQDIETRCQLLGMQPFVNNRGEETATGKRIDESSKSSQSSTYTAEAGRFITQILTEGVNGWLGDGERMPDGLVATLYDDPVTLLDSQDATALNAARVAGIISHQLYVSEMERRAIFRQGVDVEEEARLLAAELPNTPTEPDPFAERGGGGGDDDDDDA